MIDFRDYIEFSEFYLYEARRKEEETDDINLFLIPATILAWSSIESIVNNMLDDFGSLPIDLFDLHERAFLLEKRIRFVSNGERIGQFELEGIEYRRLEEKLFFLISKFGADPKIHKGSGLWQDFLDLKNVRDSLIHPRREREISLTIEQVENYIRTCKEVIRLIFRNVWKKEADF